jgi:hypothetical protein
MAYQKYVDALLVFPKKKKKKKKTNKNKPQLHKATEYV